MIKVFFVGDFKSNTGPGVANKSMREGIEKLNLPAFYSNARNKITRVFEMLIKTCLSDCVCFCSSSKSNILGIKIAKLLRKKSFYVMHGYSDFERKINEEKLSKEEIKKINKFEDYIFKNVEKTICVSEKFMKFMKAEKPEYAHKFDYNYNGLDLNSIKLVLQESELEKKKNQIISIGGGMKLKNNLSVCKAIEKLNNEKGYDLKYIVIGFPYTDGEKISKYSFVKFYSDLNREKVIRLLSQSYLYIQNSRFETFGLSVVEALFAKCNLLVSNNIGAIGILKTVHSDDLIYDTYSVNEIAEKIEKIYKKANAKRIFKGIQTEVIDSEKAAELLMDKIVEVMVSKNE